MMNNNLRGENIMENKAIENKSAKVEVKVNQSTSKVNEVCNILFKEKIDVNELKAYPIETVKQALQAINEFKLLAESEQKKEQQKTQALHDLLVSAGRINPSIDMKSIRNIHQGSMNCLYHALAARPNGATWAELDALTAEQNKLNGTSHKGLHKYVANFAKQRTDNGYIVEYNATGVKISEAKK
jgi:hypothetical protein